MHAKNFINDHPLITTAAIACGAAVMVSTDYTRVAFGMLGMAIPVYYYLTISGTKSAINDVAQPIFQELNAPVTNAGLYFSLPNEVADLIFFITDYRSLIELSCTNRFFESKTFSGSLAWEAMYDRMGTGKFEANRKKHGPIPIDFILDYKSLSRDRFWKLDTSDLRTLELVDSNCNSVKDDSLIRNFKMAFKFMRTGQSENFKQTPNTHPDKEIDKENCSFSNALDFLNNCIKEGSKLKNLVDEYLKSDLKTFTVMGFVDENYQIIDKSFGAQLGNNLNKLLEKTENFLNLYN